MSDVKSYVIPMYSLLGLCVNTDDPQEINEVVKSLMTESQESVEFRKIMGSCTQQITDYFTALRKDTVVVFVPTSFIPVKEKEESDLIIGFVEKLNETLQEKLNEQQENE